MKICFCDTETTSVTDGRLVQLAYEIYDSKSKTDSIIFDKKYKPPVPIELEAMATHHITEKMVADLPPFTVDEVGKVFEQYVFTAHNAKFDIGILVNEGVEKPKFWIDTLKIAQFYLDLPCYKLQYLRYYFNLDVEATAHDALGDIMVLKEVFFQLYLIGYEKENFVVPQNRDMQLISKFINISMNPIEIRRFSFGKYKGETFEEVAKKDIGYLQWLKKEELKKDIPDRDENMSYTLALYL